MNIINKDTEGVIKYQLEHQPGELPEDMDIRELNSWRTLLYKLDLIGRKPEKYYGLGYGNISRRLVPESRQFVISATQTGHIPKLNRQHYVVIENACPHDNRIKSYGPELPSSEALTHAAVYQLDAGIQAVIHVHSPELWHKTRQMRIPYTDQNIPYGTPEMAEAVKALFLSGQFDSKTMFSMLGHEDGIVTFGRTITEAAFLLISALAAAFEIEQER